MINTDVKIFIDDLYCPCCKKSVVVLNWFGEGYHYQCKCLGCGLEQHFTYDCVRKAVEAWKRGEI